MTSSETSEAWIGLTNLDIKKRSTAEQVAETLRDLILEGHLPQGQPLREASLAESLGVSRNTVRESFRVLGREGLVTHHQHRGAVVTRLTRRDVADIFRVRHTLELAGVAALPEATDQELEPITEAVESLTVAARRPDWAAVIDSDRRFHEGLVDLLCSRRLSRFYDAIHAEMRLCMSIVDRHDEDREKLVAEHRELLSLILARDVARCTALLSGHLRDGERTLLDVVPTDTP